MEDTDPIREMRGLLDEVEQQRERATKAALRQPDDLLVTEAMLPLTINGMRAPDFIKRAYGLGADCNGPGRFDIHDPVQAELRRIGDWIAMAEKDALDARRVA